MNEKPRIFIGSSSESLHYANELEIELRDDAIADVWSRSFKAGQYTLDELVRKASEVDFAAFILGQEDKTISRGKVKTSPRDNVIFEAGLFAGKLGISNVFLIVDEKGSKLPSDINGLVYITYNSETQKISDAIKRAGMTIRSQVKSWSQEQKRTLKQQIIGKWWQYVLNSDVGAVVSLMNIEFDKDEPGLKIDGQSWSLENKKGPAIKVVP